MDGVFTGVMEKLSSGFGSGGDIRLDIVGKRDMLGGYVVDLDGCCRRSGQWRLAKDKCR